MFGFFGGFVLGLLVALALVGYFFWKARKGMALIGVAKNAMQAADYIMKMVEKSPAIREELRKRL